MRANPIIPPAELAEIERLAQRERELEACLNAYEEQSRLALEEYNEQMREAYE